METYSKQFWEDSKWRGAGQAKTGKRMENTGGRQDIDPLEMVRRKMAAADGPLAAPVRGRQRGRMEARSSSGVQLAVPSLPTTTPAAMFASWTASPKVAPAASAVTHAAMTVSPAPLTS